MSQPSPQNVRLSGFEPAPNCWIAVFRDRGQDLTLADRFRACWRWTARGCGTTGSCRQRTSPKPPTSGAWSVPRNLFCCASKPACVVLRLETCVYLYQPQNLSPDRSGPVRSLASTKLSLPATEGPLADKAHCLLDAGSVAGRHGGGSLSVVTSSALARWVAMAGSHILGRVAIGCSGTLTSSGGNQVQRGQEVAEGTDSERHLLDR